MAQEVTAGFRRAHRLFIVHVGVALLGALICFPHCGDSARLDALEKLNTLSDKLDPEALARTLQQQAELGAKLDLASIVESANGEGVAAGAGSGDTHLFEAHRPPIQNLGEVVQRCAGGQTLKVTGPDVEPLGTMLRWRLARLGGEGTVENLRLVPGTSSQADVETDLEVEPLRRRAAAETKLFTELEAQHEYRVRRTKTLWKIKAPKKQQWKAHGERRDARDAMLAQQGVMETAVSRYEAAAEKALAFEPGDDEGAEGVVVEAQFVGPDGKQATLRMPAPRVERQLISVPIALPAELEALTRQDAWPEIRGGSVKAAIEHVKGQLSWHLDGGHLGPIRVGGATVVQLFPLLMLAMTFLLARQCAAAHDAFSPFHHPGRDLPRVGTGIPQLDSALIIGPVALTTAIAVVTLARIDGQFWIALLFGLAAIAQSVFTARAMAELKNLRRDIVRTSLPAPLP